MIRGFTPSIRVTLLLLAFLLVNPVQADEIPAELKTILDRFLGLERNSVNIRQEIHWRFFGGVDTLEAEMDIRQERRFHLSIPAYGIEVYTFGDSLITVNHTRRQILLETASKRELIDQLFVGGDVSSVHLKRKKELGNNEIRHDFTFRDEYSEWSSMKITTRESLPVLIHLTDYDGNKYLIHLSYQSVFRDFNDQFISQNYMDYELADLRKVE